VYALAVLSFGCVAVRAKHLKSWRESCFDKPSVHSVPSRVCGPENLSAVLVAVATNVINYQKILLRFTAARAFESVIGVMSEYGQSEFFSPSIVSVFLKRTIVFRFVGDRAFID
jgi:hypothetical protein